MKKCHRVETDHGRQQRETAEKPQVSEDQHVTYFETLQTRGRPEAVTKNADRCARYGVIGDPSSWPRTASRPVCPPCAASSTYLAGVLNAARAGIGVTLLALAGPPPEGLVEFDGLPAAPPISLTGRARGGTDMTAVQTALGAVHATLAADSMGPSRIGKSGRNRQALP
jgi:hypothetical protein